MSLKPKSLAAAATAFISAAVLIWAYLITQQMPMIGIFLGTSMLEYCVTVFVAVLVGVLAFWLIRANTERRWPRVAAWILALLLLVGVPAIAFARHAASFRGSHWALKAFLIGLPPVLLLLSGVQILKGRRIVSLLLDLFFVAVAAYHLVLLIKMTSAIGQVFGAYEFTDLAIAAIIVTFSLLAVWLNWRFFRARQPAA